MEINSKVEDRKAEMIAARREARRKKILENSSNRLEKISGRPESNPSDSPVKESTENVPTSYIIYPDPDLEPETYFEQQTEPLFPACNSQNADILHLLNSIKNAQNGTFPNQNTTNTTNVVTETRLSKILHTKIHIAIFSVIIYLLFATDNQTFVSGNVFLALLLWEIAEVFILKTYQTKSGLINILFLLSGMSQRYTTGIMKTVETIHKILQDVALFVFFFVLTHLFWHKLVLGSKLDHILGQQYFERL